MRNWIFLLIAFLPAIASSQKLKIEVDSIATERHPDKRVYTINYKIRNTTNDTLRLFLSHGQLVSNVASSMSPSPHYRIFSSEGPLDVETIFSRKLTDEALAKIQALRSGYLKYSPQEMENIRTENVLRNLTTLKPFEVIQVKSNLTWELQRYHALDDHEYYLDPKARHFFEIGIVVPGREQYRRTLPPAAFQKIENDPHFIEGVFISNRMEIDFSE